MVSELDASARRPPFPLKIGLFYWSLELGGVEHMMINLAKELTERGHRVTLILARSPMPNSYPPPPRVDVVWLNAPKIGELIFKLSSHLRREKYDAIFTGMPTSNVALLLARRLSRSSTKIVISERSNPILEAESSRTWRYRASFRLQRYIYPWADAIVAVSSDLAEALSDFAKIRRSAIQVIYNPAFDERVSRDDAPSPHEWLRGDEIPVVIGAGRFRLQKDFSTFLKVIASVAAVQPIRAILLGDGEERKNLECEAAALGISDIVAFPGFVKDVSGWLDHSCVFLLTSKWEGFGNILVQALASGCSIVTTDCPDGPKEIVRGGVFGALAPVGDVEALSAAVVETILKPFPSNAQKERALDFTVTRSVDQYEQLFYQLVGRETQ